MERAEAVIHQRQQFAKHASVRGKIGLPLSLHCCSSLGPIERRLTAVFGHWWWQVLDSPGHCSVVIASNY
jgi:hypothetical protein